MAIRKAPRRELKLDDFYAEQGGIRKFVLGLVNTGARVHDIAKQISDQSPEPISEAHLYAWIRRWRGDEEAKQEVMH